MKKQYTIETLLEEIKNEVAPFREGMIFETIKSIYPDSSVPKDIKNIKYKGKSFTKPLANNKKAKKQFIKENSPIADFINETTRGDFLKVVKVDGKKAKCINLSLKEEIIDKFYKNELIDITIDTVVDGYIKQYRRKVDKFFN